MTFEVEFVNGKRKERYIDDDLELVKNNSKEYEKKKEAKKICLINWKINLQFNKII